MLEKHRLFINNTITEDFDAFNIYIADAQGFFHKLYHKSNMLINLNTEYSNVGKADSDAKAEIISKKRLSLNNS